MEMTTVWGLLRVCADGGAGTVVASFRIIAVGGKKAVSRIVTDSTYGFFPADGRLAGRRRTVCHSCKLISFLSEPLVTLNFSQLAAAAEDGVFACPV